MNQAEIAEAVPQSELFQAKASADSDGDGIPLAIGIANMFDNLDFTRRLVNNIFQLQFAGAGRELARFAINSTVGVAGLSMSQVPRWVSHKVPTRLRHFATSFCRLTTSLCLRKVYWFQYSKSSHVPNVLNRLEQLVRQRTDQPQIVWLKRFERRLTNSRFVPCSRVRWFNRGIRVQ
jgi:hypothetical protein